MLKIRNLRAWYGAIEALHGIDLEVAAGEVVALVGSNRAGKTTTLRAISNLVRREADELSYQGTPLTGRAPETIPKLRIAHVPEGRQVFAGMSVLDNLRVGAYTRKRGERQDRIDLVFDIFPRLSERRAQMADTLSGGEQQMLAIGRALMMFPTLLMLDEPSQGLAPLIVDATYEALRRIARTGVTILLVEQNVTMALAFATRGYVLENGTIRLSGPTAELASHSEIVKSYLGI